MIQGENKHKAVVRYHYREVALDAAFKATMIQGENKHKAVVWDHYRQVAIDAAESAALAQVIKEEWEEYLAGRAAAALAYAESLRISDRRGSFDAAEEEKRAIPELLNAVSQRLMAHWIWHNILWVGCQRVG